MPFALLVRDLLLPALWIGALIGSDFVWRGNAMTAATTPGRQRIGHWQEEIAVAGSDFRSVFYVGRFRSRLRSRLARATRRRIRTV
jgi:hypothetical protein